jgi:hypothetical protein
MTEGFAPQGKDVPSPVESEPTAPLVAPALSSAAQTPGADLAKLVGSTMPSDEHFKFAENTHLYVREYIRNADLKAGFFFAASTAGLGYLLSHDVVYAWFRTEFRAADYASLVAVAGLLSAAAVFLVVVFPRLKSSNPGLIFFNEIAAHPGAIAFAEGALATSGSELARTKLRHIYDLAKVCRSKYKLLRAGCWAGSVGGLAALFYLALRARGF